jgi:hypothetical protein
MATESSKIETESFIESTENVEQAQIKMSLMSLQFSQPVQVDGQGQTRTILQSNFPDPNALLNSLEYMFDSENEIEPRMRLRLNTY